MQEWHKESRPERAATSRNHEDIQRNLREDFQTGDHEESNRIFCRVTKDQGPVTVEESASSEMEEEPTHSYSVRRAGNVGAPATWDSVVPTVWKENAG
jgi:hypothetical protein